MIKEMVTLIFMGFFLTAYAISVGKTTSVQNVYQVITTPLGEMKGSILTSRQGKQIYAFRGIKYAKAPVEELRFHAPVPVEKWEVIYNATQDAPACPQPDIEDDSEDCLYLNVYTSKIPKGTDNPRRPVLVFLHGGDYTNNSASSSFLGPQYLLDQDLVLVTANFRLGVLGFLNTGDKESTGNFALKDQVEVLKWVKSNILSFGGNPDSVTLAGSGSGGISVSLHLVSAISKGLFHRAIITGGSGIGNIHLQNNQLDLSKKLAKHLKCASDETPANIVKCFRDKTPKELTDPDNELKELGDDPYYTWLPTIEQDFGQERFLSAHPLELISHQGQLANLPILIGVNGDEFGYRAFSTVRNESLLKRFDEEFDKTAPVAFMYEKDTENSQLISKELKSFYFGDGKIDKDSLSEFSELYTDALSGFSANRAAELFAEKNNESVYYYRFNYAGKYSNYYLAESNYTTPFGVVNGDDTIYLFRSSEFPEFREDDLEIATLQKMVTIWGNFASCGKPIPTIIDTLDNIKWEPYTTKTKKFMDIGNKLAMQDNLNEKRFAVWEKLFPISKYTKGHFG